MPPIPKKKIKELTKKELRDFFSWFDDKLEKTKRSAHYVILGGAALVLLDIIPRSTADIDLPAQKMTNLIDEAGEEYGIEINIVTQCTTVDFAECPKVNVFQGKALQISSIQPLELLKSKLERYHKQDPQDIHDIIRHCQLHYLQFKEIFTEMMKDWVGHPDRLKMHARTLVEKNYPQEAPDFHASFKLTNE